MSRMLWCLLAVAATARGATAQEPPPPGMVRLYVEPQPKKTLSVPKEKEFSLELEMCLTANGTLAGITDKGFFLIDVQQDNKNKAKQILEGTKQVKTPVDVQPATAGESGPVTRIILGYKDAKPTAAELEKAKMKEVPGKESKAGKFIVVETDLVTAEKLRALKEIPTVTNAQASRTLRLPEGAAPAPAAAPAPKPVTLAAPGVKDEFYADGRLYGTRITAADKVWAADKHKSPVVVAVIDTGVDVSHPDLKGNLWTNPGEVAGNQIDEDKNGYADDVHGFDFANMTGTITANFHGTHVAGTLAAAIDGKGVVGVCPAVKVMPLTFLVGPRKRERGELYDAILCIDYAVAKGAKVINASWGMHSATPDLFLGAAIERAHKAGVLFVAAAGNEGRDNDNDSSPFWPASFDYPNVIAVMAVDQTGGTKFANPAWQSNYGKTKVHLAAPGHNIWSTAPNGKYDVDSGTSMAAPHVSGALALMHANPKFAGMAHTDVRKELLDRVQKGHPDLKGKCSSEGMLFLEFLLK